MRGYLPRRATSLSRVVFDDFIVVWAWECNHVVSSVAKLNRGLQRWTTVACLLSFQRHIRVVGRSNLITLKGILIGFNQYTKERLFQNNNRQQEQNALDEYVHILRPPRKLGSLALTSVIMISLKLRWRLARTVREMVGLRHYHGPCTQTL